MPPITIDLRDGFVGDAVVIRVDGREVYRDDSVSTRTQIGLAKSLTVEAQSAVAVEIEMPGRALSATIAVDATAPRHLGISIDRDGRIRHEISDTAFRYL